MSGVERELTGIPNRLSTTSDSSGSRSVAAAVLAQQVPDTAGDNDCKVLAPPEPIVEPAGVSPPIGRLSGMKQAVGLAASTLTSGGRTIGSRTIDSRTIDSRTIDSDLASTGPRGIDERTENGRFGERTWRKITAVFGAAARGDVSAVTGRGAPRSEAGATGEDGGPTAAGERGEESPGGAARPASPKDCYTTSVFDPDEPSDGRSFLWNESATASVFSRRPQGTGAAKQRSSSADGALWSSSVLDDEEAAEPSSQPSSSSAGVAPERADAADRAFSFRQRRRTGT